MTNIYLDTALLAVPNYAVDDTTGQTIIDRVIHFSELAYPSFPLDLTICNDAEGMLWGNNFGPDYDQIDAFLEIMNIKHIYSTNDLLQRYQILLNNCKRDENNFVQINSTENFTATPVLPNVAPAQLAEETMRVFASAAANSKLGLPMRVGSAFSSAAPTLHEVTATLLDFNGLKADELGSPPVELTENVTSITHLRDFISSDIANEIWRNATNANQLHLSISLGALALQLESGEGLAPSNLKKFKLGSEFYASLENAECTRSGRFSGVTRELLSQIVAGKCNRNINPFSLRGQYKRDFDGALAWRTHVTNGGAALRLMYWSIDELLEFANIDVKNDEEISHGSKFPAAELDLADYL